MTQEHTPGPWKIDYLDKNGQRVVRGEHIEICTCWHHCVIEQEMEANAHLIAAAPELLAYLEKTVAIFGGAEPENDSPRIAEARALIAKAKGESQS